MNLPPKPHLISNWRDVLQKGWSVRINFLVILVIGADTTWQYLEGILPISKLWFGIIAGLLSMLAIYFRLIYQPRIRNDKNESP